MKVLAIIPARSGSKRIPNKNTKKFLNRPLISYAIQAAKASGMVDRIIVSTDSPNIKKVAEKYGAEVPFYRPKHLSEDVPTEKVVLHAVSFIEKKFNIKYDLILTLEPPAIARNSTIIKKCVKFFKNKKNKKFDSYLTAVKINERPEWMLKIENNKSTPIYPLSFFKNKALFKFPSSKIFKKLYKIIGIVFAIRRNALFKYQSCVGLNCHAEVLDDKFDLDLDWPHQWRVAENIIRNKIK
jgi:CMP-N-acetylneuraminic acid synthetase